VTAFGTSLYVGTINLPNGGQIWRHTLPSTLTIAGHVGDNGVTLSYTGGATTSDASGNYKITIPYGWSGSVVPSKSGDSFSPSSRSYPSVFADQTGQNYTASISMAFTSIKAQDGWILESAKGSKKGGSMNATNTTLQLGDNAGNRQYKSILSFNTAGLPPAAMLQTATVMIQQAGAPTGKNPFSILGALNVDVRKGWFGSTAALQLTDFSAAATAPKAGAFGSVPSGGWYSAALNAAGLGSINRAGLTQVRLYFTKATNANGKADYMKFYSGNYPSLASQPLLVITYTLP
jgi:hypothetical protein